MALIKDKRLVGGGTLKIVNQTVPAGPGSAGLRRGPAHGDPRATSTRPGPSRARPRLEDGAPAGVRLRLQAGQRQPLHRLHGPHLRMMAAVQPFLSGAISKTVNMPRGGHRRGDRAGSTSRPGSWGSSPWRSTATTARVAASETPQGRIRQAKAVARAASSRGRGRLASPIAGASCPTSAAPITHKFSVEGQEGTSPSACTRTARRARSSSPWPRRVGASPASWTPSPPPSP